jgi:hypothetical protein
MTGKLLEQYVSSALSCRLFPLWHTYCLSNWPGWQLNSQVVPTLGISKETEWHHYHIKGTAVQFDNFFDAIADTAIFEVNLLETDGLRSHLKNNSFRMPTLPQYLEFKTEDQTDSSDSKRKIISYISEHGATQQFYRLCRTKGWLVLVT